MNARTVDPDRDTIGFVRRIRNVLEIGADAQVPVDVGGIAGLDDPFAAVVRPQVAPSNVRSVVTKCR